MHFCSRAIFTIINSCGIAFLRNYFLVRWNILFRFFIFFRSRYIRIRFYNTSHRCITRMRCSFINICSKLCLMTIFRSFWFLSAIVRLMFIKDNVPWPLFKRRIEASLFGWFKCLILCQRSYLKRSLAIRLLNFEFLVLFHSLIFFIFIFTIRR